MACVFHSVAARTVTGSIDGACLARLCAGSEDESHAVDICTRLKARRGKSLGPRC